MEYRSYAEQEVYFNVSIVSEQKSFLQSGSFNAHSLSGYLTCYMMTIDRQLQSRLSIIHLHTLCTLSLSKAQSDSPPSPVPERAAVQWGSSRCHSLRPPLEPVATAAVAGVEAEVG